MVHCQRMKTNLLSLLLLVASPHFAVSAVGGGDYVAHEWGTFTSVQTADGVPIPWNPLASSELPSFVYDWNSTNGVQGDLRPRIPDLKASLSSLQRMETPVIYFYADSAITVDAMVDFPQGMVTEWYPKASPHQSRRAEEPLSLKALAWKGIEVLPDLRTTSSLAALPSDPSGSHYYAARETDAGLLRVNGQTEKFLFYRGVGNFSTPLKVTQRGNAAESLTLSNTGGEDLRHLVLYQVTGGQGRSV